VSQTSGRQIACVAERWGGVDAAFDAHRSTGISRQLWAEGFDDNGNYTNITTIVPWTKYSKVGCHLSGAGFAAARLGSEPGYGPLTHDHHRVS
jgi:hypothetical protein